MCQPNKSNTAKPLYPWRINLCKLLSVAALCLASGGPTIAGGPVTKQDAEDKDELQNDKLKSKHPVFDRTLVDRRVQDGWEINTSGAIIKLHAPTIDTGLTPELTKLHASYEAAYNAAPRDRGKLISVNILDAKCKQFDDGLYAALVQAHFQGMQDKLPSHVLLVRKMFDQCKPDSQAAAFLAAGLSLAAHEVPINNIRERDEYLSKFNRNTIESKPISFFTWNDTLKGCWRFMKFFQQPLTIGSSTAKELTSILKNDAQLKAEYERMTSFYAGLTNPAMHGDLIDMRSSEGRVSLLPPSTSREIELFNQLYSSGIPANSNLMEALIVGIKSGKVNLAPDANSGWYGYQAFALETFLLPERGKEYDKLLLTKNYKRRMIEAFEAMLTSRRETHAGMLGGGMGGATNGPPPPPRSVSPRLRVEPSTTFYLRTARAYAYLQKFLSESIGDQTLAELHGLAAQGQRTQSCSEELEWIKRLFYGMYLVSCEDIGLRPQLNEDEHVDSEACYTQAEQWLQDAWEDSDLSMDRRVCIPIAYDENRKITRLWMIVGVRLVELDAKFANNPMMRLADSDKENWKSVTQSKLVPQEVYIAVDEFAEVELTGNVSLTRDELREICDGYQSKAEIIQALQEKF